jgi:hypothetical protein
MGSPPVVTARGTPSKQRMKDGYKTLIANSLVPTVAFWEREVTPPGADGGEMIDTTTMFNTIWKQFAPRALVTLTPVKVTAGYNDSLTTAITGSLLNKECSWTVHFPSGSTLAFYGFLRMFTPAALVEGTFPTAEIEIVPTNTDPSDGSEAAPVFAAAGSDT